VIVALDPAAPVLIEASSKVAASPFAPVCIMIILVSLMAIFILYKSGVIGYFWKGQKMHKKSPPFLVG
jgi:hypothetical protein